MTRDRCVLPFLYSGQLDGVDYIYNADVMPNCKNGTLYWDYPQGHSILHFPNPAEETLSVCVRNFVGGEMLTVTDITNGHDNNSTVGDFTYGKNYLIVFFLCLHRLLCALHRCAVLLPYIACFSTSKLYFFCA